MKCVTCGTFFKQKSHLERHRKTAKYCLALRKCEICDVAKKDCHHICETFHLISKIKKLENQNNELKLKEKELETKNKCLEKQMEKLEKQQNKLLERSTNTTNYVSKKKIVITAPQRDFSVSQFMEAAEKQKLTSDHIRRGYKGIAKFIANSVTDDNGIPNYVISDAGRNKFKYYFNDLWRDDMGGRKLVDEVYPDLAPKIGELAEKEYEEEYYIYMGTPEEYTDPILLTLSEIKRSVKNRSYLKYEGEWNKNIVKELQVILKHHKQLLD